MRGEHNKKQLPEVYTMSLGNITTWYQSEAENGVSQTARLKACGATTIG
jgi:hypothetical protein